MKTKILSLLTVFALSALLVASCKRDDKPKDKEEEKKEPTKEELVMANTWKITKFETGGIDVWNLPPVPGMSPMVQPCQKDNLFSFNADNLLLIDEGETKCSPADPQSVEGAWFMAGEDKMYIDMILIQDTATILSVSATQLVMEATVTSMAMEGKVTFTKQ